MKEKIEQSFEDAPEVSVLVYSELTAELATKYDAKFILEALEIQQTSNMKIVSLKVKRDLNSDLETVFLITLPELAAVNSSIIREVHKYGGDVSKYLPYTL